MALAEIEFELPAVQYELMGYPGLRQGESLAVVFDAGVLLPDPGADAWFAVRQEPLTPSLQRIGPAWYAFAGQITDADIFRSQDAQSAVVVVNCGPLPVRLTCGPQEDGMLPWGTWETRFLTGIGRLQGIVEEDYQSAVGQPIGVTIWNFRRLVLAPGDPLFGQWHETVDLPPLPYRYDRIYVTARVHSGRM